MREATEHAAILARLPEDTRARVRERAALIWDGNPGMTWDEADRLALDQELARLENG